MILNIINEINVIHFIQIYIKKKNEEIDFQSQFK